MPACYLPGHVHQTVSGECYLDDAGYGLPLAGDQVTCGNRTDLPRKQRRHHWADLGGDFASHGEAGIVQVTVRACLACGRDDR